MEEEIMKIKTEAKSEKEPPPAPVPIRDGVCITLNDPFRDAQFAANKTLSEEDRQKLEKAIPEEERLLFVIVGDLNLGSWYDKSILAVTDKRIYGFDSKFPGGLRIHEYDKVRRAYVKRYYGNAVLVFSMDDPEREFVDLTKEYTNFIRFSYKVASLYDAAAVFIQSIAEGKDSEEELRAVEAAFEKQFCVCPKCGRTLIRPGAQCMNCQSKNKVVQKLGKYVLPHKKLLLVCLILSVITTAVSLVSPYMTKLLVDDVLPKGSKDGLTMCVLVLLCAYLIQYGIGAIRSYLLKVCGDRMVADLRNDVYKKAQQLPMRFYDRTSTGSVINRISGDTSTIQAFVLRVTQEVVVQLFLLIGIIVIMFAMNWQLTLLSLIPVPLVVMGSRTFGKKIRPFYRRIWRRWSAVTSILTDNIPGIRIIKAFTNEKRSADTFTAYNQEWLKTDIKASKITTLFPNVVGFVVTCGSLLIWSVGGNLVIDSPTFISVGLLVSFISYTSMFYGPVNFFANFNDSYQNALNSAERLLDIIDAEPEADFAKGAHPDKLKGHIERKKIGIYSSVEKAENAIVSLKSKNGFKDTVDGFRITKVFALFKPRLLDNTYWVDGFETYIYSS